MADIFFEIEQKFDKKIIALLQQVERLREQKASVIASLREVYGEDGEAGAPPPVGTSAITSPGDQQSSINFRDRMLRALDIIPSTGFGTADLLKAIDGDGMPPYNKSHALKIFQKLVVSGAVEVLSPRNGSVGGIYRKVGVGQKLKPIIAPAEPINRHSKPTISAVKRVYGALDRMSGEFTSADLRIAASNDGNGPEIKKPSFQAFFPRFAKEGLIETVIKANAGKPGVYRRTAKALSDSAPSSTVEEGKLFDE